MFEIERYHDFSAGHRVVGHESKCSNLHGHNYRAVFTCQPMDKTIGERLVDPPYEMCRAEADAGIETAICRRPKGHEFKDTQGHSIYPDDLDSIGRVVDFSVLKNLGEWIEEYWDHKMLIWQDDPARSLLENSALTAGGIVIVSFNPTAENMARYLVEKVGPMVLKRWGVVLVKCRLEETRKCSATFILGS